MRAEAVLLRRGQRVLVVQVGALVFAIFKSNPKVLFSGLRFLVDVAHEPLVRALLQANENAHCAVQMCCESVIITCMCCAATVQRTCIAKARATLTWAGHSLMDWLASCLI